MKLNWNLEDQGSELCFNSAQIMAVMLLRIFKNFQDFHKFEISSRILSILKISKETSRLKILLAYDQTTSKTFQRVIGPRNGRCRNFFWEKTENFFQEYSLRLTSNLNFSGFIDLENNLFVVVIKHCFELKRVGSELFQFLKNQDLLQSFWSRRSISFTCRKNETWDQIQSSSDSFQQSIASFGCF